MIPRLVLSAFALSMTSTLALAQTGDDMIIMRRVISPPTPRPVVTPPPPTQTPTPVGTYTWTPGQPVADAPSCSENAPAHAPISCLDGSGNKVDDSLCTGPKPDGATTVTDYSGCTYRLDLGEYGDWSKTCGQGATASRTNACIRLPGGASVDVPTYCNHPTIDQKTADVYSGCEGTWYVTIGACGADAKADYIPECGAIRAGTYTVLGGSKCDPTKMPQQTRSSCEGIWKTTPATCTAGAATATGTVYCQRNGGDNITIPDAQCHAGSKPEVPTKTCAPTPTPTPTPTTIPVGSCGTLTPYRFSSSTSSNTLSRSGVTTVAAAQQICNDWAKSAHDGVCAYNAAGSNVFYYQGTGYTVVDRTSQNLYAAYCR